MIVSTVGPIIPESFSVSTYSLSARLILRCLYLLEAGYLVTLFFADHSLPAVKNIAVIRGLLLIIDNHSKSLLKVMEPNIRNLLIAIISVEEVGSLNPGLRSTQGN